MAIYGDIEELGSNFNKEKFGERLEFLIGKKGVSKQWVADKLGITKQALHYLLKHSSKPKYIDEISVIMDTNPMWLEFGDKYPINEGVKHKHISDQKIQVHNTLSILTYFKDQKENSDLEYINYNNAKEFIAYKIENDSVFPPFMENSVLIFDKTKSPSNGDYVLIITSENNSVLVRQYSKDGNDIYFHSKNNSYKSLLNVNVEILGVLVEARYTIK